MSLLPNPISAEYYWRDVYNQPQPFWQPAITQIAAVHALPPEPWERISFGRNVVFGSPTTIIKLGPPCWGGEMVREVATLHFVAGKLPVATPTVLAQGNLDGWDYSVQTRLSGTPLWQLWSSMPTEARADLAYQHGQLMDAVHNVTIKDAPAVLQFDWQAMIAEQREQCAATMQAAGVDAALLAQVDAYLDTTMWSYDTAPYALLHGDLNHLNFLVTEQQGKWQIHGIIDWGDVKIGPHSHEYISPSVHMYKGNSRLLAQWYAGYGLDANKRTEAYEHILMARSMLYYAEDFAQLIQTVEGAADCQSWTAMARCFWRMTLK